MIAFFDLIDNYEDRERFKQLYEKYRGLMAHIAGSKAETPEDVEDILQDAFFYIAKNFDRVGTVDSPRTKCFGNYRRLCNQQIQKREKIYQYTFFR